MNRTLSAASAVVGRALQPTEFTPHRRGLAAWPLVAVATAGLVVVGLAVASFKSFGGPSAAEAFITQRVTAGLFVHDVVERGELESSANTAVRCEVQSRTAGTNGVKILEIVPEGTVVNQGDFLVKFDDAALQADRTTQQINLSSAEATSAQSANDLDAAIYARKEYEFGEFESEKEKLNGEILVARENTSRAEETVQHSEKLTRRGYLSRSRLRSDQFDLAKAQSELKTASTKLKALTDYTWMKKIKELDAKVKTCEAKLKSDEAKLALEQQKLAKLDEQIKKCVIHAPVAGQVVYDHEQDNWRGAEYQIKQGAVIHEQRVVIRLPDPKQMQVVAKVAEARIDLVKPGMTATIEVEGLPGVTLQGKVTKVNEYPESENWFNSSVKQYATKVQVDSPPTGLRPGMTAKVAIRVESIPAALQVPVQSVVERGGKHYCLLVRGTHLEPREVLIGSTNEKFLVIRDGLIKDEEVLVNPRVHLASVQLPAVAEPVASPAAPKAEPTVSASAARADAAGSPGL